MTCRILPMGDAAFTVEFSDLSGATGARRTNALGEIIRAAHEAGDLAGVIDVLPASRSLTLCLDPAIADYDQLCAGVLHLIEDSVDTQSAPARNWTLPACYEGDYGPDLEDVAITAGLTVTDLIELHSRQVYDVYLIGFLPGFAFMGPVPEDIQVPRRKTPRTRVPAGSVAMANDQTCIYPWASPGGWHLLARCPVPLFDSGREEPSLLRAGDRIRFTPVDQPDLMAIERDLADGVRTPESFASRSEGAD